MKPLSAVFEIVDNINCPLYEVGEHFRLTDKAFSCYKSRELCLILVREMTKLLYLLSEGEEDTEDNDTPKLHSCSGCTGLIKFRAIAEPDGHPATTTRQELSPEQETLLQEINTSPLFNGVPQNYLAEMLDHFREETIKSNHILTHKGEPNQELFLILSGQLSVDDGPLHIITLGPGEICGEMSYLAGSVAGATVQAITTTRLVAISREQFSTIVKESPSVQLYMAQLLARRLAQINSIRIREFDSCMQGRLNEMGPAELFQVLHLHQKTGVLSLNFPGRSGEVSFREGNIINARYENLKNQEAIFKILTKRDGIYTFKIGLSPKQMKAAEIGDFMMLLMEGVRRIDEATDNG